MRFIVTAGPTREYLDPVRFLSNPSTGRMGFAVARAAHAAGHDVTLIAGPVALRTPPGVRRVDVVSARDMLAAVLAVLAGPRSRAAAEQTVLVMTAAVADWRPARRASRKLKKSEMSNTLRLVRNPDILKTINRWMRRTGTTGVPLVRIGFAAETGVPDAEAARKCRDKGLDLVVGNDVTRPGSGFGTSTNRVTFVTPDGRAQRLPLMSKLAVARRIVAFAERIAPCQYSFQSLSMKPLILASGSPRRAKILRDLGVEFEVVKTEAPEVSIPHDPVRTVTDNALAKLRACGRAPALAADTIVWFDGKIYGKPRDLAEAKAFLRELSGQTHTVFTGVAYVGPGPANATSPQAAAVLEGLAPATACARSHVTFRSLSPAAIDEYVARVRPLDRAGAYDIDENGDLIVASYDGEYENIMGLPVEPLRRFGII